MGFEGVLILDGVHFSLVVSQGLSPAGRLLFIIFFVLCVSLSAGVALILSLVVLELGVDKGFLFLEMALQVVKPSLFLDELLLVLGCVVELKSLPEHILQRWEVVEAGVRVFSLLLEILPFLDLLGLLAFVLLVHGDVGVSRLF